MAKLILNETTFSQYEFQPEPIVYGVQKITYYEVAYSLTFTNKSKVLLEKAYRVYSKLNSHTAPNCKLQLQPGESNEFEIYFLSKPIETDTNDTIITGEALNASFSLNQLIKGVEVCEGLHLKATQIEYPVT